MRHGCWGLQFSPRNDQRLALRYPSALSVESHSLRVGPPDRLGLPGKERKVAARGNAWTFLACFDLLARQAFNELPASDYRKLDTAIRFRVAHNRLGFATGSDRREVLEEALPHHDDAAVAAPKMLA